jgi:hypothetical protein
MIHLVAVDEAFVRARGAQCCHACFALPVPALRHEA